MQLNPNLVLAAIVVLVLASLGAAVALVLTGHQDVAWISVFVGTTVAALVGMLQAGNTHAAVTELVSGRGPSSGEGG